MALRVLLADESNTIKKVFQLALQDYAVEVRPVNIGLDVVPVAASFRPDIIFADVLLQKKSGYEVSAEVKKDSSLKDVPVVLMWSGFMELDEDKFQASRANAQLEKPFDVGSLRKIVQELVPKTKTQKLSGFLTFPPMPEFTESKPSASSSPSVAETVPAPPAQHVPSAPKPVSQTAAPPGVGEKTGSSWDMESFDPMETPLVIGDADEEEFQQVNLAAPPAREEPTAPKRVSISAPPPIEEDEEETSTWQQKDLSRFRIDLDDGNDLPIDYVVSDEEIKPEDILHSGSAWSEPTPEQDESSDIETPPPQVPAAPTLAKESQAALPKLSPAQIEEIVREQSREIIETVVWRVVPELAARIIERELKKLLDEKDQDL